MLLYMIKLHFMINILFVAMFKQKNYNVRYGLYDFESIKWKMGFDPSTKNYYCAGDCILNTVKMATI